MTVSVSAPTRALVGAIIGRPLAFAPASASRAGGLASSFHFHRGARATRGFASTAARERTVRHPSHPTGVYFHLLQEPKSGEPSKKTESELWAISLLEQPPSNPEAASIMGYVRTTSSGNDGAEASGDGAAARSGPSNPSAGANTSGAFSSLAESSGSTSSSASMSNPVDKSHADPGSVQQNAAFFELMHRTLRDECVAEDELLRFEAQTRGSGWAHLNDERELLMPGRQAWPENILASVGFVDGELIVPRTGAQSSTDGKDADSAGAYQPNDAYRLVTAQYGFIQLKQAWLYKVRKRCAEAN